ncbi:STAS domain-containing protein [Nocardia sp. NPDC050717]|uniref:STAS domain-containing protein n=1 Tax=Nocardia sp. NPDC050717 TaxID=3157221 RepID=UPI0033C58F7D
MNTPLSHDRSHSSAGAEPDDVRARLRAETSTVRHGILLRVHGEIDAYTFAYWRRLFDAALLAARDTGHLLVDLDAVEFMSCRAIAELADSAERSHREGLRVSVVRPSSAMVHIATVADLALPVYPDVDAATIEYVRCAARSGSTDPRKRSHA